MNVIFSPVQNNSPDSSGTLRVVSSGTSQNENLSVAFTPWMMVDKHSYKDVIACVAGNTNFSAILKYVYIGIELQSSIIATMRKLAMEQDH